jgi:hypothetical protein
MLTILLRSGSPVGLWGGLYWYGLYPFHRLIFGGLVRAVARDAERVAARG